MKRMSSRAVVIIAAIVLALLLAGIAAVAYAPAADERDTGSKKENTANNEPANPKTSYSGDLVCLPHKGNPEVTTMECAVGLKTADGVFYGLREDAADGSIPEYMTMPTGEAVTIKGVFEKATDDKYDTVGTINVSSVQKQE